MRYIVMLQVPGTWLLLNFSGYPIRCAKVRSARTREHNSTQS